MKTVAQLCYDRLIAANPALPATLYFENVDGAIPTGDHLIVNLMQVPGGVQTIGKTAQRKAILHVVAAIPRGNGQIKAIDLGQLVLNLFPKNLKLQANPLISVDVAGVFGTGYNDGNWYKLPVKITINYIET